MEKKRQGWNGIARVSQGEGKLARGSKWQGKGRIDRISEKKRRYEKQVG